MSLSFYYEFTAPAETTADDLEAFLCGVEELAQSLGFAPTVVLNVPLDTPERRVFARRLGGSFTIQNENLKGVAPLADAHVRDHDPISGECRLIPRHGVVLAITDERGGESCFGFFQFPEQILNGDGMILANTGLEGRWWFRDFVASPDPRFREIAGAFRAVGYLRRWKDEFA